MLQKCGEIISQFGWNSRLFTDGRPKSVGGSTLLLQLTQYNNLKLNDMIAILQVIFAAICGEKVQVNMDLQSSHIWYIDSRRKSLPASRRISPTKKTGKPSAISGLV